jgi:ATP-dependent Clp protease ATP-binding subunit ClpA
VHNLVGAGDAEGSMNAANILKPALSRGEIQVIGATTFNEYRKHIEKDAALERRFQPVTVAEPTIEQSIAIIRGISHYYETFHGVVISPEIARQAVLLSERYITDRFLPDKAIDLIDEACSDVNLKNKNIGRLEALKKEHADYDLELSMLTENAEKTQDDYARMAELRSRNLQLDSEIAELEKLPLEQLIDHSFGSIFPNMDAKWLRVYERTALYGETLEITDYSPEIDTELKIVCFPTFPGHCGCMLFDRRRIQTVQSSTSEDNRAKP